MKILNTLITLLLSISFVFLPQGSYALSKNGPQLISTISALETLNREALESDIEELIKKNDLKSLLLKNGVNVSEISARMKGLTDLELAKLKVNVDEAKAGAILVEILLVILIIYFARRI